MHQANDKDDAESYKNLQRSYLNHSHHHYRHHSYPYKYDYKLSIQNLSLLTKAIGYCQVWSTTTEWCTFMAQPRLHLTIIIKSYCYSLNRV